MKDLEDSDKDTTPVRRARPHKGLHDLLFVMAQISADVFAIGCS